MSTVYLTIQISVGRVVALKVMNPQFNSDPAFSERFQREANIVGQLSHPNIVSIYDIGRHEDLNYIAMDYLPNGTVHDKMTTGISGEDALRITREIASALDHAHEKGYIHRDIKPENILFRADNSAVLSDFGVARSMALSSRMTQVGTVVGTPHYMSPEQTKGKPVDGRSDLYSLGVVLFEMLTGSVPYQGDEAVTIALKHISAPIPKLPLQYLAYQKLIDKLLAKDPEQRFQRGRDLVAAIEELEKSAGQVSLSAPTHPVDMSVITLASALLNATLNALRWRWNRLCSLRWQPGRGFYLRQPTKVTEIFFNEQQEALENSRQARDEQETRVHASLERTARLGPGLLLAAGIVALAGASVYWGFNASNDETAPIESMARTAVSSANGATTVASETTTVEAVIPPTGESLADASETSSIAVENALPETQVDAAAVSSETAPALEDQAQEEKIITYALEVLPVPANARVRIMNIPERYQPGMLLPAGRYDLEVSHPGYDTYRNWIDLNDQSLTANITLKPSIKPGTELTSTLTAAIRSQGPEMISIPAGSFYMGDKNDTIAMPVRRISLRAFAISKYEITFDDYDIFAQATNRALPGDNKWGRGNRPAINISYEDALAYTTWLSQTTGKRYRLPTEAEWEYVARANSQTRYWWGDDERDGAGRANCRRGCNSKFSGLFGSKTAPVGSYPANGFGVFDTAGNVSEWVQDCYTDNYSLAPKNGQAYEVKNCQARVVRGGSAKHNIQQLGSAIRDYYPPSVFSEHLGFRVVMEL